MLVKSANWLTELRFKTGAPKLTSVSISISYETTSLASSVAANSNHGVVEAICSLSKGADSLGASGAALVMRRG